MRKQLMLLLAFGYTTIASLANAQARPEGEPQASKNSWPLFRGDGQATGRATDSLPDKLEVLWTHTSADINDTIRKYSEAEQAAVLVAQQMQTISPDAQRQWWHKSRLNRHATSSLRPKVAEAFEARQRLLRAELAEFQRRLAEIEATITTREQIKDAIIDKRVEELLKGTSNSSTQRPKPPLPAYHSNLAGKSCLDCHRFSESSSPLPIAPTKTSETSSNVSTREPVLSRIDAASSDLSITEQQAGASLWKEYGLKVRPIPQASLPGQRHLHGGVEILEMSPKSQFRRDGYQQGDIIVGLQLWETLSASNVNFVLSKAEFQPDLDGTLKPINVYFLRGTELMTAKFALEPRNHGTIVRDFDGDGDDDIGVFTAPRDRQKTGIAPLNEARPKKGTTNRDPTSLAPATDLAPSKDQPLILRSAPDFGRLLEEATTAEKESTAEVDAQLQELRKTKPAATVDDVKKQYPMVWIKLLRATGRRNLLGEEYAAQIRLLETELHDAESAAAAALELRNALEALVKSGGAPRQKFLEAQRTADAAQSRVERAKTLLELFQKVSEKAAPLDDATKSDETQKFE